MSIKCPECGLRYRGEKGEKPSEEKVERHNKGYSHNKRIETVKRGTK